MHLVCGLWGCGVSYGHKWFNGTSNPWGGRSKWRNSSQNNCSSNLGPASRSYQTATTKQLWQSSIAGIAGRKILYATAVLSFLPGSSFSIPAVSISPDRGSKWLNVQMICTSHLFRLRCQWQILTHVLFPTLFYSGYCIHISVRHLPLGSSCSVLCKKGIANSKLTNLIAKIWFTLWNHNYTTISSVGSSALLLCCHNGMWASSTLTITYLSTNRYMGLSEPKQPKEFSSHFFVFIWLKWVSNVIILSTYRYLAKFVSQLLLQFYTLWSVKATDHDKIMLRAAACLHFFGFFHAGKISIPTAKTFWP